MLHLPKKGYWLFGDPELKSVPNTSSMFWVIEKDFKGLLSFKDLRNLCFVHGDIDDLLSGKKCVIRDKVSFVNSHGYWDFINEKVCFHLSDGGVLLYIGYTRNGNPIVVFKS